MSARLRDADFCPLVVHSLASWSFRILVVTTLKQCLDKGRHFKKKTQMWGLGKSTPVNSTPGNIEVLCGNQSAVHSWLKYVTEGLTWLWFMGQLLSCVSRQFLTSCLHFQETIHDWFCNLSFGGTSCISYWKPTFLPLSWWCYPGFRFGSLLIRFLREPALVRSSPGQVLRTRCSLMFAGSL